MVGKRWTVVVAIAVGYVTGYITPHPKPYAAAYFSPSTECENHIIAEIQRAHKIDIAMYSITNHKIANAIISAHLRGAKIRIITDHTMAANRSALNNELAAVGIPVQTNRRHKIEHNKFAVFDNRRIVTGSYNWTRNASESNSENCVFLDILVTEYSRRFDYLWRVYAR